MCKKYIIVTGSSGCIGAEVSRVFSLNGYDVIGIDILPATHNFCRHPLVFDFYQLVNSKKLRESFFKEVNLLIDHHELSGIVHCAGYQEIDAHSVDDVDRFIKHQCINSASSLLMYRLFFNKLNEFNGQFINIGSIHSILTKEGFVSYAASKSSLRSLTRSLSIENRGAFRILSIEPAAINTPMLRFGFSDEEKFNLLKQYHPVGDIGTSEELAKFTYLLFSSDSVFLHGSCIDFSGGIAGRLHDPD